LKLKPYNLFSLLYQELAEKAQEENKKRQLKEQEQKERLLMSKRKDMTTTIPSSWTVLQHLDHVVNTFTDANLTAACCASSVALLERLNTSRYWV